MGQDGSDVAGEDPRDDAALLQAHADGDPDAFGELVRRHRDRLWAVALRTLGHREEAADALQDALLSAFRAGRSGAAYRGDAAVTTWLHRIVVNACLDRVRRRAARPTDPLPEHDVPARGDALAARVTGLDVEAALRTLHGRAAQRAGARGHVRLVGRGGRQGPRLPYRDREEPVRPRAAPGCCRCCAKGTRRAAQHVTPPDVPQQTDPSTAGGEHR